MSQGKPNQTHKVRPDTVCKFIRKHEGTKSLYFCFALPERAYDEQCNAIDELVCGTAKALDRRT